MVSVKLISAMPRAAGPELLDEREVREGEGRQAPRESGRPARRRGPASPNRLMPAIPAATAISGAGDRGRKCSSADQQERSWRPRRPGSAATCRECLERWPADCGRSVPLGKWMPSSFGTWSSTMTSAIPALKPISTGSEMKLATKPSRSSEASTQDGPHQESQRCRSSHQGRRIAVRERLGRAGPPARMARVVVVLTLSGREVPSSA